MPESKPNSRDRDLATAFRDSMDEIGFRTDPGFPGLQVFRRCANSLGFTAHRSESWSSEVRPSSQEFGSVLMLDVSGGYEVAVLDLGSTLACVRSNRGLVDAWVATESVQRVAAAIKQLKAAFPPTRPHERSEVAVDFSWLTSQGTRWMTRALPVPPWNSISPNYPMATRRPLRQLIREFKPNGSGQTVVWHGRPGTGKTSALRALAWEWRKWCEVTVVLDPDQIFGTSAGYLLDVIARPTLKHRLVVLEDAGELLRLDARREVGQGLSRFLNACDGLLGQGQKLTMLVTTNEPIKSLHPAVSRAGRCAAEIEFTAFDRRAANRWLAARCDARTVGPATLAELYALSEGREPTRSESRPVRIGFGSVT